jgi:hypothetical protein
MTISLNNVAVQQFSDDFINQLSHTKAQLDGTVRTVRGVVGDAYKWKLAGNTDMESRGAFQSIIPASDIDYQPVTTTMGNWVLKLPTDIFEQAEVNADERSNLAVKHAGAIARRKDQIIINALDDSTTSLVIAAGGTNLTVDKLRSANRMATQNNWQETNEQWHIAVHANNFYSLLGEEKATSDYYNIKALIEGKISTFLGFTFHVFGDMSTGGLPKTGNTRTCFAWIQDGAGYVESLAPEVTVDYDRPNRTYLSVSSFRAGGSPLLTNAVIQINCDESAVV